VGSKPAWAGTSGVPAGKTLTVWELSKRLSVEGKAKTFKTIHAALDNDEDAAEQLEQALPLVHEMMREMLKKAPNARGAPRLRLILSLFDDAVMPNLGLPAKSAPVEDDLIIPRRG